MRLGITPKTDFIFNRLFSKAGNEDMLIDFLESILEKKIHKIEIIPEARLPRDRKEEKYGTLDLKATIDDGTIIDVEMQVRDNKDIEKRTVYYAGKLIGEQLKLKDRYEGIKNIIMINILDYEFIDLPEYHTEAITVSKKHRDYEMIQTISYHFIELPKFRRIKPDLDYKKEQWLLFIDGNKKEDIEMIKEKNKMIKKASEEYRYLTGEEEIKRLEFLKMKAILDENSRMGYLTKIATEEGMAKGLEKGMKQGVKQGVRQGVKQGVKQGIKQGIYEKTVNVTKNMLKLKFDLDVIEQVTGLDKNEILKLAEGM